MLLVEVAQRHRVREELVQIRHALVADRFAERDRHLDQVTEGLDLVDLLVLEGSCLNQDLVGVKSLGHASFSFAGARQPSQLGGEENGTRLALTFQSRSGFEAKS